MEYAPVSKGIVYERGILSARLEAHEIKFSIEVSIGLVLSDLRKDARPGVRAKDVDGMRKWDGQAKGLQQR